MPASHQTVKLSRGRHRSPDAGVCVMELASMLAGEPFSDHPDAVAPTVASVLRACNDGLDDRRRQGLLRFASASVGTSASRQAEKDRRRLIDAWIGVDDRGGWRAALTRRLDAADPYFCIREAARRVADHDDEQLHRRLIALLDGLVASHVTALTPPCCAHPPQIGARTLATSPQPQEGRIMIIAADYPFMDILGSMLVFFLWIMWFWTLIVVLSDVFGRTDLSGWGKAGWMVLTLFLPILGVLVYLIANGGDMADRRVREVEQRRVIVDDHIREVAGESGSAAQIAQAKDLLDHGVIDSSEYEQLKRKALSV